MASRARTDNVHVEAVTRVDDSDNDQRPYREITEAVQRTLDDRLKEAEQRTNISIEDAVKRALERQTPTQPSSSKRKAPDFRLAGNKKRYETNEDVIEHMEGALENIEAGKLTVAKTHIEAGKKILSKQQKLIRLVDREENG